MRRNSSMRVWRREVLRIVSIAQEYPVPLILLDMCAARLIRFFPIVLRQPGQRRKQILIIACRLGAETRIAIVAESFGNFHPVLWQQVLPGRRQNCLLFETHVLPLLVGESLQCRRIRG